MNEQRHMQSARFLRHLLRCVAILAAAVVASATPAASLSPQTSTRDPGPRPGSYAGVTQGHYELTFTVDRSATRLRGFDTSVVAYCIGASGPTGPTVWRAAMPTIRLTRSGRFDKAFTVAREGRATTIRVRGDLDRGRLTDGTLMYDSRVDGNTCTTDGPQPLTAQHQ